MKKISIKALLKPCIFFLVALCSCNGIYAQQDPMFTQYFTNQMLVNPAYAGSRDGLSMVALYRHQWAGFKGAPVTQTLSMNSPILKGNSNIGIGFIRDKIGITERLALNAAYAYRIDFGGVRLAFGLHGQARLRQVRWDLSNPLEQNDLSVDYTRSQLFLPNFGAGIYLDADRFFLGFSVPHMLENELEYVTSNTSASLSHLRRHFFLSGGLVLPLSDNVKLRPMALWKYVESAPMELDLNLGIWYKEKFLIGGTYRTSASFDLFAQFQINHVLRMGYAYDYSLTHLQKVNSGSHEIMLGIDLKKKDNGFDHPRFF